MTPGGERYVAIEEAEKRPALKRLYLVPRDHDEHFRVFLRVQVLPRLESHALLTATTPTLASPLDHPAALAVADALLQDLAPRLRIVPQLFERQVVAIKPFLFGVTCAREFEVFGNSTLPGLQVGKVERRSASGMVTASTRASLRPYRASPR